MLPDPPSAPPRTRLIEWFDSARKRMWAARVLVGLAAGCGVSAIVAALLLRAGQPRSAVVASSCGIVAAGALAAGIVRRSSRTAAAAARALERRAPECRNVVITAEELLRHPRQAPAWIVSRVFDDAARRIEGVPSSDLIPLWRHVMMCVLAAALLAGVLLRVNSQVVGITGGVTPRVEDKRGGGAAGVVRITAIVEPPAYLNAPNSTTLVDPDRIEVVQGSRIRLRLRGPAPRVRYGTRVLPAITDGESREAHVTVTDSGYFAVEALGANSAGDSASPARLIAVIVTPDRAPSIRIEAPGRDLLLPDASGRISISASAADDFALRSLEVRYTRVSGSGEQFEFEEGTLPVALARDSDRAWKATTALNLPALKLQPGDSLVYRALARDGRPGDAGLAASDTFFVEIAGPGQVALSGFEMPPDEDRYALSQQMIVLKIERLRGRARTLNPETLREQAVSIAAEQRAVRANFIFLMGGHVEDEEEEAEQSHEIQEGRLHTSARAEVRAAITHMTRAEQALSAVQVAAALPPAKAAVEALQRAFGRNRYLLRTLPVRSRIDPARRLSGELTDARDWRREIQPAVPDAETRAARALLARLLEFAPQSREGRSQAVGGAMTALAEEALAIGPSDPEWQRIAQLLQKSSDARSANDVNVEYRRAIAALVARIQRRTSAPLRELPSTPLRSAWAEARR